MAGNDAAALARVLVVTAVRAEADAVLAGFDGVERVEVGPSRVGPTLTVSTVTGTDQRAVELASRHGALAEAMEGAGVCAAAAARGVAVLEIRAISNPVGRRDRAGWDVPGALAALSRAFAGLL